MMKNFPDIPSTPNTDKLSINNISGLDLPVEKSHFQRLLTLIEEHEGVTFSDIEVVFVDEEEILRINNEYLNHDYVTDIITFHYNEDNLEDIEGTLYCCASRIVEQSNEFDSSTKNEYLRVFAHGLIHLAGYNDKTEEEKLNMTSLENKYLELLNSAS